MVPCGPCRSLDPPCPRSDTPIAPLCRLSSEKPKSNRALLDLLPLCIGGSLRGGTAQIGLVSALDGWSGLERKCLLHPRLSSPYGERMVSGPSQPRIERATTIWVFLDLRLVVMEPLQRF